MERRSAPSLGCGCRCLTRVPTLTGEPTYLVLLTAHGGGVPGECPGFHRGAVTVHALTAHAGHCPRVGGPSPVRCRVATLLFTGEPLLPAHELPTRPDCKKRALPECAPLSETLNK